MSNMGWVISGCLQIVLLAIGAKKHPDRLTLHLVFGKSAVTAKHRCQTCATVRDLDDVVG